MNIEVLIQHGNKIYYPIVQEDISWSTERKGSPGKLEFTVVRDEIINISEGDPVRLCVDSRNLFYGFIFTLKTDKNQSISVTAYDQIRYLKNKDTYVYANKTASEFVRMVANDYGLCCGSIEQTGYKIESRVEDNTALIDMIQNALDLELTNRKVMYILYDDCGKLILKSLERMKTTVIIDEETGENYDYSSSIDSQTYNQIKLTYENDETKKRDIYIAKDGSHINEWGLLQYCDTLQEGENGQAKADALLSLYNSKTRNLKISNALGHTDIRAGSMVVVKMDLVGIKVQNYMLVESCKHMFKENEHRMDLTLRGGEFVA